MHYTKTSIRFRFYTRRKSTLCLSLPSIFSSQNHNQAHNVTYRLHYYVIPDIPLLLLFFQVHISIPLYSLCLLSPYNAILVQVNIEINITVQSLSPCTTKSV